MSASACVPFRQFRTLHLSDRTRPETIQYNTTSKLPMYSTNSILHNVGMSWRRIVGSRSYVHVPIVT